MIDVEYSTDEYGKGVLTVFTEYVDAVELEYLIRNMCDMCNEYLDIASVYDDYGYWHYLPYDEYYTEELIILSSPIAEMLEVDELYNLDSGDPYDATGFLYWYTDELGEDCPLVWWNGAYVECVSVVKPSDDSDEPTFSVQKWDWYADEYTIEAYNSLVSLGAVEDFNFSVWNKLVDKVNEIIQALKSEWYTSSDVDGSTYLSLEDTKMTEDDPELSTARFNTLRFNIGSRFSTEGIISKPIKEINDEVSAGDFLALADHINNWIDNENL